MVSIRRIFQLVLILVMVSACAAEPVKKSIYVGKKVNVQEITKYLKKYNANAVVFDVKDDIGRISSAIKLSQDELVEYFSSPGLVSAIKELKKKNVYTIARLVTFKDFIRKDFCIKNGDGSVRIDKEKTSWMDPYNREVWAYLKEICVEAINLGFDEVQLDYVRFSSYFKEDFDGNNRIRLINEFIDYICKAVHDLRGKVSVCVFGCTLEGSVDTNTNKGMTRKSGEILGQDYVSITETADFVCPMIYPSHYPQGTPNGIEYPDLEPYNVIRECMKISNRMLSPQHAKNKVRPYLQAFTAKWLKKYQKYGEKEIQEQIRAVSDCGVSQWGLFNMKGAYDE